jgi:branched-chain amino acid transport system substrate-binding protein
LLKSFGDEAIGMINSCPYTHDLDNAANKQFVADFTKDYGNIPGFYAAGLYVNGQVVEAALKKTGGDASNKEALIAALRAVSLTDTPRGPISFDDHGNVIGNIYIRRIEKQNGALVNHTVKTYEKVSQFWTYDEKTFLSQPVYSRDYPPLKS